MSYRHTMEYFIPRKKAQHAGQMGMFGIAGGLPPNLGYAAMGPSQLAMVEFISYAVIKL